MFGAKSAKKPLDEKLLPTQSGPDEHLARVNTFADEGVQRQYTFSRAFTFDGAALQRHVSQPFEGLARTLTSVGNHFDPDAKFTNEVVGEISRVNQQGNEGDIPVSPGFARTKKFWRLIFYTVVLAAFMGIATSAFMNFSDEIPKQWTNCKYEDDPDCGEWYNGQKYWIAITTGAGFTIGVIRWAFSYPDNLPGIFKDINTFHVEPKWTPITYTISALSLAGGATLGPEQALGNLGGGIAYYITSIVDFEDEDYDKIFVLSGMASALGALFPSPMLGALMMHELGEPPKTFMESTIILSVSSVIGFAVYYELINVTYLETVSSRGMGLAIEWLEDPGYDSWQLGTGAAIGIISGALCIFIMIVVGINKQVFFRIRTRLAHNAFLREVVPPTLGGLIIGLINWALPATVGNGNQEFTYFVKYGCDGTVSQRLLLCTGFARAVLLGVSMSSGFCGGIIFPFLTMGMIAGAIMYQNYEYVPKGLCIGAFMVAIPAGIVPMPFTFTALVVFAFYFGLYQVAPLFIAVITSFLVVSGSGLFKKLTSRQQKQGGNQEEEPHATAHAAEDKKEDDDFAIKQYLGNKKPTHLETPHSPASH